jgi:hypothetical protein
MDTSPTREPGTWDGTCGFRLMPDDELTVLPSRAVTAVEADGWGWSLRYTWTHPDDGEQSGTLLLASPDDEATLTAAWLDSWHQKPDLRLLTGTAADGVAHLEMEYDGWGWTIEVRPDGDELRLAMHNVVPSGVAGVAGGPYLVMDAHWQRTR